MEVLMSKVYLPLRILSFLRRKLDIDIPICQTRKQLLRARLKHLLFESAQHFLLMIRCLYFWWLTLRELLQGLPMIGILITSFYRVWERLKGLNDS